MKFQIATGFSNLGYVSTPTNYFTITTKVLDLYDVDTVTNLIATPALTPATLVISSLAFSSVYTAAIGVNLDISVKFGAHI